MSSRQCDVEGCQKPYSARGMCKAHYDKWRASAAPEDIRRGPRGRSAEDRFWEKVEKGPECWKWTGARSRNGAGVFFVGRTIFAHRFSWELHNGPILDRRGVYHLCPNPHCVRPEHLDAR